MFKCKTVKMHSKIVKVQLYKISPVPLLSAEDTQAVTVSVLSAVLLWKGIDRLAPLM
jgi:hypothetical protein